MSVRLCDSDERDFGVSRDAESYNYGFPGTGMTTALKCVRRLTEDLPSLAIRSRRLNIWKVTDELEDLAKATPDREFELLNFSTDGAGLCALRRILQFLKAEEFAVFILPFTVAT